MRKGYHELLKENELLTNQHGQLQQEVLKLRIENEKVKGENQVLRLNIVNAKNALDLGIEKEDNESPF